MVATDHTHPNAGSPVCSTDYGKTWEKNSDDGTSTINYFVTHRQNIALSDA